MPESQNIEHKTTWRDSSEELSRLVEKGILKSSGTKGRGAKYLL